jgi:raffinose/stachyose/melibiose transport system substrate-binding protein
MKKNKLFTLGTVLLSAVMLFTACGSSTKTTENTPPAVQSGLKGEVVYWSMWNETEPQAMVIKDAIADFTKVNPGAKITVQWSGREIRKTLVPALDAGQKIDMWDEDCERIIKNYQKYSLKLDDLYAKIYPTTNGKSYKDSIMGSLVNLVSNYSTDKGLYAVPYQPMMIAFMYNKAHFEKAGITNTPKTWTEFVEVCEKLKGAGFIPMTNDDAYADLPLGYHLSRYIGEKAVEELVKDKTGAKWDDPKVLQALKDYEDLAAKGYISPSFATNKWPAGQQEVATDKVTMYLNGTWLPNEIMATTGPDFKWGQFAYPAVNGGAEGITAGNYGAQGFQIHKDSKASEVAFNFAVFMTTGKWDKELSAKTYGAPMALDTVWPTQVADEKELFSAMEILYPWGAGVDADSDKLPILNANFTKLCTGKITAADFIKNAKGNVK